MPGPLNGKALFLQIFCQKPGCQVLFQAQFGVQVQVMGDALQFPGQSFLQPDDLLPIRHKKHRFLSCFIKKIIS